MSEFNVGDWISFYRSGTIVYSEIRYIRSRTGFLPELCTPDGITNREGVLECRRANLLQEDDDE